MDERNYLSDIEKTPLYNKLNKFITSFDVRGYLLEELVTVSVIESKNEYIFTCLIIEDAPNNLDTFQSLMSLDVYMSSDVYDDILIDDNPTHYEIKEETRDSECVELIKKPIGEIALKDI